MAAMAGSNSGLAMTSSTPASMAMSLSSGGGARVGSMATVLPAHRAPKNKAAKCGELECSRATVGPGTRSAMRRATLAARRSSSV